MQLKRINVRSAIFFGVAALVFYLISGLVQWIIYLRNPAAYQAAFGVTISPLQSLVFVPIIGGIIVYLLTLIIIGVYNMIAKSNPISWEVK